MKLYGSFTSPFVRHCRIALAQEGIDYEMVEADYNMSAEKSPTSKVPFFTDGDLMLTDSSSIVKYIREKSGGKFLADINEHETFTLTNTILDSAINLFLLETEGVTSKKIKYLGRQENRVESGLKALNDRISSSSSIKDDGTLRCACFLAWGIFRNRINIDSLANLQNLVAAANQDKIFAETAPPK